MTFREAKGHIRAYLQSAYSDEKLCALLCHARDGKLVFHSCCCLAGVADANHNLRGYEDREWGGHVTIFGMDKNKWAVSESYEVIAPDDARRRRILIPMILAEVRRRDRLRQPAPVEREEWSAV